MCFQHMLHNWVVFVFTGISFFKNSSLEVGNSGESRTFLIGRGTAKGGGVGAPAYYLANFFKELHENKFSLGK